jgi:hypothetical protein
MLGSTRVETSRRRENSLGNTSGSVRARQAKARHGKPRAVEFSSTERTVSASSAPISVSGRRRFAVEIGTASSASSVKRNYDRLRSRIGAVTSTTRPRNRGPDVRRPSPVDPMVRRPHPARADALAAGEASCFRDALCRKTAVPAGSADSTGVLPSERDPTRPVRQTTRVRALRSADRSLRRHRVPSVCPGDTVSRRSRVTDRRVLVVSRVLVRVLVGRTDILGERVDGRRCRGIAG